MRGKTHIRIGMAVTAAAFNLAGAGFIPAPVVIHPLTFGAAMAGSLIGSLLMDNDARGTAISRFLPLSNRIITWLAGKGVKACYHRHLFHSLLFLPLLAGLLVYNSREGNMNCAFACGIFLGLVSHALADAVLSNTWLLYPLSKRPFSLFRLSLEENRKLYGKIEKYHYKAAGFLTVILTGSYFYLYLSSHT